MSSLERFYEYAITVICIKNQIDRAIIAKVWKEVASQSERQLGAFIYCYMLEFKSPPTLIQKSLVLFRNDVIHKGVFPNRKETIDYGNDVLRIFKEVLRKLNDTCREEINQYKAFVFDRLLTKNPDLHTTIVQQRLISTTIFNKIDCTKPYAEITFEEYLKFTKSRNS